MQVVYPLRHLVHAIEKNRIIYRMTQYNDININIKKNF